VQALSHMAYEYAGEGVGAKRRELGVALCCRSCAQHVAYPSPADVADVRSMIITTWVVQLLWQNYSFICYSCIARLQGADTGWGSRQQVVRLIMAFDAGKAKNAWRQTEHAPELYIQHTKIEYGVDSFTNTIRHLL